jgi:hypothetical protein
MPRVNWNSIEREEERLEKELSEGTISQAEYHRQMNDLHREVRDEYAEQQERERRDEFGDY